MCLNIIFSASLPRQPKSDIGRYLHNMFRSYFLKERGGICIFPACEKGIHRGRQVHIQQNRVQRHIVTVYVLYGVDLYFDQ